VHAPQLDALLEQEAPMEHLHSKRQRLLAPDRLRGIEAYIAVAVIADIQ
jgi:hypothetical protein